MELVAEVVQQREDEMTSIYRLRELREIFRDNGGSKRKMMLQKEVLLEILQGRAGMLHRSTFRSRQRLVR